MEYQATMSEAGRVVIPIEIRNKLGLQTGDKIFFSDETDNFRLKTRRSKLLEMRELLLKHLPPGRDLEAELFEERRREFEKERAEIEEFKNGLHE